MRTRDIYFTTKGQWMIINLAYYHGSSQNIHVMQLATRFFALGS